MAVCGGAVPTFWPVAPRKPGGSSVLLAALPPLIEPNSTTGPPTRRRAATATGEDIGNPRSGERRRRDQPFGTLSARSGPVTVDVGTATGPPRDPAGFEPRPPSAAAIPSSSSTATARRRSRRRRRP